jgi:hypothetical protein
MPPTTPLRFQDSRQALPLLPHKDYDRAQLLLFAGRRDNGKTFLLREFIEEREPRVFALDPFEDFHGLRRRVQLGDALDDMAAGGPCRRRVVPPVHGSRAWADVFFGLALERLRDCLLVLDEITLWSEARETEQLRALVLQGRRLGIRLAVACQRISLVPGVLLSECTELVLFNLRRPRDLVVVGEWAGPDVAEQVPTLRQGECVLVQM